MATDKYSGFYKSGNIVIRAEKCDIPKWRSVIFFGLWINPVRVWKSTATCNDLKYYTKISDQEAKELLKGYEEI